MEAVEKIKYAVSSRYVYAIISASLLQLTLYAVIDGLLFISFWNPIYWFFNAKLIAAFLPMILLMFLIGHIKIQTLTNPQVVPITRFQAFMRHITWRAFLNLFLFAALSASVPLGFSLLNRISVFRQCQDRRDRICIDRHNLFVVLSACWSGIFYAYAECLTFSVQTRYPVIHQNIFMKQRSKYVEILKESLPYTMLYVLYFFPVFYVSYPTIVNAIQHFLAVSTEDTPLISTKLVFQAWVLSAVVYSSLKIFTVSLDFYLSQNLYFPVPEMISVLDATQNKFYIELVLQDLYLLAHGRGTAEIAQVFALGGPGGAPSFWEGLLGHCFAIIRQFNSDLGLPAKETLFDDKREAEQATQRFPLTMRRLGDSPDGPRYRLSTQPGPVNVITTFCHCQLLENLFQRLPDNRIIGVIEKCKKTKFFKYFFDVDPDLRETFILENSQKVVWAVGALSVLASRALAEDRYGLVVSDLPTVITELLNTRTTVHIAKKKHRNSEKANRMRVAIRDVTSRGLFRISRTYGEYLDVLPLAPEALHCLRSYLNGSRH